MLVSCRLSDSIHVAGQSTERQHVMMMAMKPALEAKNFCHQKLALKRFHYQNRCHESDQPQSHAQGERYQDLPR